MNIACRTISGSLCIKGDHSDVMYMLNTGWIILLPMSHRRFYDFNLLGLKLAEQVRLPVAVAFDGFFTSHQKRKCLVFSDDAVVQRLLAEAFQRQSGDLRFRERMLTGENCFSSVLDLAHPARLALI